MIRFIDLAPQIYAPDEAEKSTRFALYDTEAEGFLVFVDQDTFECVEDVIQGMDIVQLDQSEAEEIIRAIPDHVQKAWSDDKQSSGSALDFFHSKIPGIYSWGVPIQEKTRCSRSHIPTVEMPYNDGKFQPVPMPEQKCPECGDLMMPFVNVKLKFPSSQGISFTSGEDTPPETHPSPDPSNPSPSA